MKIVLLTLSGQPDLAVEQLGVRFPGATIDHISRDTFESESILARLSALRARRPDILAVATERLVWQRGQNHFLLLGSLAGARRTMIVDAHGDKLEESRTSALLHAPARILREAAISGTALRRAQTELRALEAAVARSEHRQSWRERGTNPKIVYLRSSPGPGTQAGGAASHINGFLSAAQQLGVDVSLVTNDEIAGLDQATVSTKIIWPQPIGTTRAAFDVYNNFLFSKAAAREIERQSPDFIYQRYARFSWAGVAASLRTKRPLFLEYNGSEVWLGQHWDRVDKLDLLMRYERLNLKAAARIFVVAEVERQNLLKAGVAAEKIVVNPNAVDVERFRPGVGGDEVRRQFGIGANETLAGFVGTFGPWHGVEVLAQAITRMPRDIELRFLLIGSGALRDRVEQILREGGAADRMIMLGPVSHDRVPSLLDGCDLLVSPHIPLDAGAEFFGSPTKLFEYMAMGKGIVASRLGQIGEVLEHEKTALLVEPGDVGELTDAIVRIATSPDLRERLGAAARREAVERHTWKHNAQRVLNEYASL